ncbi:MAG: hypothetical protein AB1465_03075 [Patescibacteria group bacterium]
MAIGKHICHIAENGYCNCANCSEEIIRIAKDVLLDFKDRNLEGIAKILSRGICYLVCKECGHKGMLGRPILGPHPDNPNGGSCNAEEDFIICPKCGHWGVIFARLGQAGDIV